MTKIEELEQKLNECQKALAELKESKKEGKWKPQFNEQYWYKDSLGNICNTFRLATGGIDEWRLGNISVFKTKEECERYWHFMDTVKEKSYEFSKEEIEGGVVMYGIFYDFGTKDFGINYTYNSKDFGKIYFKTKIEAQYIIDNFKDELMEYWI